MKLQLVMLKEKRKREMIRDAIGDKYPTIKSLESHNVENVINNY